MAMSLPSITTKKFEWVFYMLYTVRVETRSLLRTMLTSRRSRSILCAIGIDPVLYNEALVLPLLLFTWPRNRQCNSSNGDISFQNTRRWVFTLSPGRGCLAGCTVECLLEIGQHPEEAEASEYGVYRRIFRLRAVHLMAFFILIYVGYVFCEESVGLELNTHHLGWKLQLAAGSLRISFKSEVVDRPPVIFPLVFSEV